MKWRRSPNSRAGPAAMPCLSQVLPQGRPWLWQRSPDQQSASLSDGQHEGHSIEKTGPGETFVHFDPQDSLALRTSACWLPQNSRNCQRLPIWSVILDCRIHAEHLEKGSFRSSSATQIRTTNLVAFTGSGLEGLSRCREPLDQGHAPEPLHP